MERKDVLREKKVDSVLGVMKLMNQISEDMGSLIQFLFNLQEDFQISLSPKSNTLREMSQGTDTAISNLINKIERNINIVCEAIISEVQVEPFDKKDMDNVMIRIMYRYDVTSTLIQEDSVLGENYAKDITKIHKALNRLESSIKIYNEFAVLKN